jgi:hypothetical protein
MGSKLYDRYKNEHIKMEKAHQELLRMIAIINKFTEALKDDYTLINVTDYRDFPTEEGITAKHNLNAKDWPNSQQLIGQLADMLKAYNKAKEYWNDLPPEEQKLVNPPLLPKPE